MLPLAGSDPTVEGYDEWLNKVSILHQRSSGWNNTVRWLFSTWKHYFSLGLTPREALMKASVEQTERTANEHLKERINLDFKGDTRRFGSPDEQKEYYAELDNSKEYYGLTSQPYSHEKNQHHQGNAR